MSEELKQLRISLATIRCQHAMAVQKEREFYALWKDSISCADSLKKAHTDLIIREAELLGKVEKISTHAKIKVRLEGKVEDVLTASLKSLSKDEKDKLLADLLATIPH